MDAGDGVAFVTVFTVYNASSVGATSSVVVGNASYGKVERSMAVLNTFVNFIQVLRLSVQNFHEFFSLDCF